MHITTAVSTEASTDAAATEVVRAAVDDLDGRRADIAFLFVSRQHAQRVEEAFAIVSETLGARHLVGLTAESVLGGGREFFDTPALSLWAAALPAVEIESFTLDWPADDGPQGKLDTILQRVPSGAESLIILADPFTFPAESLAAQLALERPGLTVAGGMASGASAPGENRLFLGTRCFTRGAVAVALSGAVQARPVVSQGCRPFGKPLVVTRCEENLIHDLGGKPALEKFTEQVAALESEQREALTHGLHIGRAVDSGRASDGGGEFLIRGVLGFVKENGSMVIGDHAVRGQTIQFHLRDPESASQELDRLLERARGELDGPAAGALLFTCNGRGTRMFETESHDAASIERHFEGLPVAGFFAAGEIGPVGARSYLHGFTAVTLFFAQKAGDDSAAG